jgi:hypothetical protein
MNPWWWLLLGPILWLALGLALGPIVGVWIRIGRGGRR